MGRSIISSIIVGAAFWATSVLGQASTVDPIVIKGQHFFYKTNGTQFYMRGVAYQQDVSSNGTLSGTGNPPDPLADSAGCARDIPYLLQLNTNTIRVYAVDPTQNHDACMNMLAAAGIYVVSDLSEPTASINRDDPAWTDALYQRYISVIDMFSKYNNVIGFFAGNEVSNLPNNTAASAFVKAAVRDSKAYIVGQGYRPMGVGYATYDGPIRDELAQYFDCGDTKSAIDFWGYNVYSWCGDSNFVDSNYQARTEFFQNYNVPVFFAEYGCNTVQPRTFTDVPVLFGPQMDSVWSGGIVYTYFQEVNNYGLVQLSGSSVSPLEGFTAYSTQIATVSPSITQSADYTPTNSPTICPSVGPSWAAVATPLPPSPNQALCTCMMQTRTCVVNSNADPTLYGDTFSYICSNDPSACDGILANATSGTYGAFSMCDDAEKLSYVADQYYQAQAQDQKASACSFSGLASTQSAASATGSCSALLSQAGANGAGTVASPTANASNQAVTTAAAASGSGSGSSSSSTATGKGAAAGLTISTFDYGLLSLSAYVICAALTGAGMILL